MASIEIPDNEISKLLRISGLPQAKFDEVTSSLKKAEPALTEDELATAVLKQLPHVNVQDVDAIVHIALNLARLSEELKLSPDQIADLVLRTASDRLSASGSLVNQQDISLKNRLVALLKCGGAVSVGAKALKVLTDHEHVFLSARIISDVRSVFTDTLDLPSAAVLVHNLKIVFKHNGLREEFFLALDTNDLAQLKKAIERAEKKSVSLKALVEKLHIKYLEVTPGQL